MANEPTIAWAATKLQINPSKLTVTPTRIALRSMCAAAARVVGLAVKRRLSRVPLPHVQTMDTADSSRSAPVSKKEGPAVRSSAGVMTDRANTRMTDEMVVRMTWDHQENQEARFSALEVCRMTGSVEITPPPPPPPSPVLSEEDNPKCVTGRLRLWTTRLGGSCDVVLLKRRTSPTSTDGAAAPR